jgi:hypothetical protein
MDDFDLKKLQQEQDENDNKKLWINATGNAVQGFLNVPTAYELLKGQKMSRADVAGGMKSVADSLGDPTERQGKLYKAFKDAQEAKSLKSKSSDEEKFRDPNSVISKVFREKAKAAGQPVDETMSAFDIKNNLYDPKAMDEIKARGIVDRQNAAYANSFSAAEKEKDRQHQIALKSIEDAAKKKELNATQAKQRGLFKSGLEAEQQYRTATSDKNDYDPTAVGQIIDNSKWAPNWMKNDNAIKAQAAKDSWIESYLRDASGAAIPANERGAYEEIYFEMPGDPPEVVANKARLRQVKMESAAAGAGSDFSEEAIAGLNFPSQPQAPKKSLAAPLIPKANADSNMSKAPTGKLYDPRSDETIFQFSDGTEQRVKGRR